MRTGAAWTDHGPGQTALLQPGFTEALPAQDQDKENGREVALFWRKPLNRSTTLKKLAKFVAEIPVYLQKPIW
jgi:hypothetical protein